MLFHGPPENEQQRQKVVRKETVTTECQRCWNASSGCTNRNEERGLLSSLASALQCPKTHVRNTDIQGHGTVCKLHGASDNLKHHIGQLQTFRPNGIRQGSHDVQHVPSCSVYHLSDFSLPRPCTLARCMLSLANSVRTMSNTIT